jgi:hypothetical protein
VVEAVAETAPETVEEPAPVVEVVEGKQLEAVPDSNEKTVEAVEDLPEPPPAEAGTNEAEAGTNEDTRSIKAVIPVTLDDKTEVT